MEVLSLLLMADAQVEVDVRGLAFLKSIRFLRSTIWLQLCIKELLTLHAPQLFPFFRSVSDAAGLPYLYPL